MNLIWKLLKQHVSIFELGVFFVANLIGLAIILCAIQLYSDIKPLLVGENSLIGSDYMIITRPVERFGQEPLRFSGEDIEELHEQAFIADVGAFVSSEYEVYGGIVFSGQRLSTMMFFESVLDAFVDVESRAWRYEPGDKVIPIIIPRNYLNLYNFGFSSTQGLPQITEDMIKRIELDIELSGNGLEEHFRGSVVGFSDRLNTILVPISFMNWANERYADGSDAESSRLILEVADPASPELATFLRERGYVAEEQPAESSKAMYLLKAAIAIIVVIGVVFSILSIIILTLSIYLLLQKNIDKLENLMLIGYTPRQVASPYVRLTIALNIAIMLLGIGLAAIAQQLYMDHLSLLAAGDLPCSPIAAIVAGVVVAGATALFNIAIIRRKIGQISRKR